MNRFELMNGTHEIGCPIIPFFKSNHPLDKLTIQTIIVNITIIINVNTKEYENA